MFDKIKKKAENKIQSLRREQLTALNRGDRHTYQCICNELKGISFVLNMLR